jgi:hypothetical protein
MADKRAGSAEEMYDIQLGKWGSKFGPYVGGQQAKYYIDEGYIEFYEKHGYIWAHHPTHHKRNYGVRVEINPGNGKDDPKELRFTIRQRSNDTYKYCTYWGPIDPNGKVVRRGWYSFSASEPSRLPLQSPPDGDWVPPVPPPDPLGDDAP